MTDPSDRDSDDSGDESESSADAEQEQLPSAWEEFRPLVYAILTSALLHFGLYGIGYWISTFRIDIGADVEWLSSSDELSGLGHRSKDRYADLGDVTEQSEPPDEPEQPESPELQEQLEEALKGEYEPPDPPEPKDEPDQPKAKTERAAKTEPRAEADEKTSEEEEETGESAPTERRPEAFEDVGTHRALNRAGPNNLPDMRSFAPGNARMSALVRVDRIRGQPYEKGVRKILRAVPDYRILLGVPDFDPVRDMDWFFMASPDPRYIQHTFLAVQHRLSQDRVRMLLDRRFPQPPAWTTYQGYPIRDLVPERMDYRDPRKVVLADEQLALVAKQRLLPQIVEPLSRDSKLLARASEGAQRGEEQKEAASGPERRASLLDGLAKIHRVAQREKTVLLLSARGLVFVMPGVGRLPKFESVRMKVSHPEQPTLNIDLQFKSPKDARQFAGKCPAMRQSMDDAIPFSGALGLSELLNRLDCRAEGAYVNVHAEYTPREVTDLAELAYPFIPRPPALAELPEPSSGPPGSADAGGPSPDATGPDAGRTPPDHSKDDAVE